MANAKAREISELDAEIASLTKKIDEMNAQREAEKTAYEANAADLGKGVSSLEGAIADAKGGQSLLQMKMSAKRGLIMADTLGLASQHHDELTAFLQASEGDKPDGGEDYEAHGAALIAVFEGLDKEFLAKKAAVEQQEAEAKKDFNALLKTKQGELKEAEENKATAEEEKDGFDKELGEFTEKMVTEEAILKDDQLYMKDLTAQCELKAREWDQQSAMRADEVSALTKALEIIQAKVVDNSKVSKRAFLQEAAGPTAKPAPAKAHNFDVEDSDIGDVLSFIQVSSPRSKINLLAKNAKAVLPEDTRRDRALSNLAQKSSKLKSAVLMSLVMRAAADPFVKVKKLIQDLIEKLVTEAAEQATKKGWCDTEMGKANNDRDSQMATVMETNAVLAGLEAKKDQLTDEIATLTQEIADLNDALTKTTKERTEEKAENTDTLDKAKEGLAAVKDAYDVLASFYKGAGKAKVSLAQMQASPVQGPAGSAGGAYKGNQAKGGGILAMLEVIISDFERTIKVTTKSEKEAAKEFTKFERTTKASIASKETSKSTAEFDLKDTEMTITENMDDLEKHQDMLDDTLKTLEQLKPSCVDTGMSYEERVQKRKDEIEALKTAMCQLDAEKVEAECQ